MDAIVSGSAGVAVLVDGDRLASIHAGAPGCVVNRSAADIHLLLGESIGIEVLEDVSKDDIVEYLGLAQEREQALQLFVILLDSELSAGVREEAAGALEELIGNRYIREHVECVVFAQELPRDIDVSVAFDCCRSAKASIAEGFLRRVIEVQAYVVAVRREWDAIPEASFTHGAERTSMRAILVREGCFRHLVEDISCGKMADEFFIESMLLPSIRVLPNNREILLVWTKLFRSDRLPQPFVWGETDEWGGKVHRGLGVGEDFSAHRAEIMENVQRQKEGIVSALDNGKMALARKCTRELVKYQMAHGGGKYACKSLCDLAMVAKKAKMSEMQLEFTQEAIELKEDDGWSWAQHGDALLCNGRLDEAMRAYENAHTLGQLPIAETGRAGVLKACGRLDEALALYENVISRYPYEVVAKNGRAEMLRALGRLEGALAAYDKMIDDDQYDAATESGRAETLRDLNRLDEALVAYDRIISYDPYNSVAKNARAETLKDLNRLEEALDAYDETIADDSYDVVAKSGRSEVLKAMNKLPEALKAYEAAIAAHPENAVAKNGRAGVLKAMNKLPKALKAYEAAIAAHPDDVVGKNGRAGVLKAMNKLPEALVAYEEIVVEHPEDLVAKNGRACVLAGMKRWDEALELLPEKDVVTEGEWIGYHIRGMVLMGMGDLDGAIAIFEEGVKNNPRPADKDYFRTALATARLAKREDKLVAGVLEEVYTPRLQTVSAILKMHAFGRQKDRARTAEIYETLPTEPGPVLAELVSELHWQYVAFETPHHNEEWLIEKEIQYFLLAA